MIQRNYKAWPTLRRFHKSKAKIRGVLGPVGSGKSTACCYEIVIRAHAQRLGQTGKRRTKFAVVRNTYSELRDTTIVTWEKLFGDAWGEVKAKDKQPYLEIREGELECDILFRALDRPDDIRKLLSMELTGAWINEAREIPKAIIDRLDERVGRYPDPNEEGCSWHGLIMDTNPPDDDHWWYDLAEKQAGKLTKYEFFRQPGGLIEDGLDEHGNPRFVENPEAENLETLEKIQPHYYLNLAEGKKPGDIRVYYCAQYGFSFDGKPIYQQFRERSHVSKAPLEAVKGIPIAIGIDFGLTPAAVFGQKLPGGRWIVVHEFYSDDMGAETFTEQLCDEINAKFKGHVFSEVTGDPAGEIRAQTDETTIFQIMNKVLQDRRMPMRAWPAPSNDPTIRIETVESLCKGMINGYPKLLISPTCRRLIKAMKGGYCYKRLQVSGEERYRDVPNKNMYSHIADACQYLFLGGGEGMALITPNVQDEEPEPYEHAGPARAIGGY